jgi:hypothetical protein
LNPEAVKGEAHSQPFYGLLCLSKSRCGKVDMEMFCGSGVMQPSCCQTTLIPVPLCSHSIMSSAEAVTQGGFAHLLKLRHQL